ncbi:MAG TPA: redoxin domain-containing protein [Chitinophagaceae bacterium]|nr:redoxin domain-containing protein [Chitinophagaceae bacterium]
MKKIDLKALITILLLSALAMCTQAQSHNHKADSIKAAYLRFPTIPPFELLQLDSTTFTKENLQQNTPLLLMFFSPDCDHCQHQTEDLLKDIEKFKNVQIVFASYQPFDQLKAFHEKYKLGRHSNIKLGRDTKYFLPPFYRMFNLPYLALYNSKGALITTFEGNVNTERLAKEFKQD